MVDTFLGGINNLSLFLITLYGRPLKGGQPPRCVVAALNGDHGGVFIISEVLLVSVLIPLIKCIFTGRSFDLLI
jgi:hypothetical protein